MNNIKTKIKKLCQEDIEQNELDFFLKDKKLKCTLLKYDYKHECIELEDGENFKEVELNEMEH